MKSLKVMSLALALSLSALPLSASMALAEDTTAVADTNTATTTATVTTTNSTATNSTTTNTTTTTDGTAAQTTAGDTTTSTNGDLTPVVDGNGNVVDPGVLPDSPFYWITQLIDKLQVILTTDPAKKAALLEDQALEKMAEAETMLKDGNTQEAQTAMDGYSQKLSEAQAFLDKLAASDSETMQKLELALGQTNAKNIQTLGGLLDKLPPQAQQKVALNIVRSMEKSIAKMEKKDQLKLAKELKKAANNVDEENLTKEDQATVAALDQTLQDGTSSTTAAAGTEAKTMSTTAAQTTSNAAGVQKAKAYEQAKESASIETEQPEVQKQSPESKESPELKNQNEQKQVEPTENDNSKNKEQGDNSSENKHSNNGSQKGNKGR